MHVVNNLKLFISTVKVNCYLLSETTRLFPILDNITKLENYTLIIEKLSNLPYNLKKMLNKIFSLIIIHYNYKFTCNM